MWTEESRARYERKGLRYPSDATDAEWAIIQPLLPPLKKPRRKDRPPPDQRTLWDAMHYQLATGCQWRQLPKDFPPKSTVHDYFVEWMTSGVFQRIHYELYRKVRELAGKNPHPTTTIVDSQSVKSAEKGGPALIRSATTPARRSKVSSVISRSIRSAS
jgi:transposase